MKQTECDKFVLGRITAYVVTGGGTALVRVFDDRAKPVYANDNVPSSEVDALLVDWMVEETFRWSR